MARERVDAGASAFGAEGALVLWVWGLFLVVVLAGLAGTIGAREVPKMAPNSVNRKVAACGGHRQKKNPFRYRESREIISLEPE